MSDESATSPSYSAGGPTVSKIEKCAQIHRSSSSHTEASNAGLQGLDWVCLHNLTRWLRLHHYHFSKDFPLSRFGGWLGAGLQHAQTWKRKLASFLHLLGGNTGKDIQCLRAHGLFELTARCQRFSNA